MPPSATPILALVQVPGPARMAGGDVDRPPMKAEARKSPRWLGHLAAGDEKEDQRADAAHVNTAPGLGSSSTRMRPRTVVPNMAITCWMPIKPVCVQGECIIGAEG